MAEGRSRGRRGQSSGNRGGRSDRKRSTTETQVVMDFSPVQFMSSSMLGKLVNINKKCKEFRVNLKLCGVSKDIFEVFKITKLNKVFDIQPDIETARKSFNKRGLFG